LTRFKITFTSAKYGLRKQEVRSQVVEAKDLEEAEGIAHEEAKRYPVYWSVRVEQITA
jgi:hypothetical protein